MTGTIGGYGITVTIGGTALTYLIDGEIPEYEKIIAEATPQNATSGYAVFVATGKRKLNEFKLTLGWDITEVTHAAVMTNLNNTSLQTFVLTTPGSDETLTFSGFVTKVGRVAEQEDYYKCEVTIQPSGAPS